MSHVIIDFVKPSVDVKNLVNLNCREIETWHHYNKEGKRGPQSEWKRLSKWERYQHGGPWFDPELLRFHLGVVADAGGIILVARANTTIIGELELLFETDQRQQKRAHISWIVIDPTWRRQGIGTQLLTRACQIAQEQKCTSFTTIADTVEAETFYRANGLQVTSHKGNFRKRLRTKKTLPKDLITLSLEWQLRKHPPMGFTPIIGNNYTAAYTWTYLRQMEQLFHLLKFDAPIPHLWLLRQNENEAITVDGGYLRIWISQTSRKNTEFLKSVLEATEYLSLDNGVNTLQAHAFPQQYAILKSQGYTLEKEDPFLSKTL